MPRSNVNPKRKKARAGYMISAVAELYKLHPQTLRLYERVGLLKPSRSDGNTRLYTDTDLERLEVILTLTREMRGLKSSSTCAKRWPKCSTRWKRSPPSCSRNCPAGSGPRPRGPKTTR
jgi:hypothetical protein